MFLPNLLFETLFSKRYEVRSESKIVTRILVLDINDFVRSFVHFSDTQTLIVDTRGRGYVRYTYYKVVDIVNGRR